MPTEIVAPVYRLTREGDDGGRRGLPESSLRHEEFGEKQFRNGQREVARYFIVGIVLTEQMVWLKLITGTEIEAQQFAATEGIALGKSHLHARSLPAGCLAGIVCLDGEIIGFVQHAVDAHVENACSGTLLAVACDD